MAGVWRVLGFGLFAALLVAACGDEGSDAVAASGAGAGTSASGPGSGGSTTSSGEGGSEPMCPHEGPDVLDPSTLEVCPMCAGGARCVPASLIPAEYLDQLADCDDTNKCVPDDFIKTNGNFIPQKCTSVAGGEGRCLSQCLGPVAEQAALLPQDICPEFQLCAPCYDPLTGEESGACSLSCDPGPTEPPVMLPKCCGGIGTCVPKALVPPAQADALPQDRCPMDQNDYVCAPDAFISDPNYMPDACVTDTIIGGGEPGVCLPDCLITGWESFLIGQSSCPDDWSCAPCDNPLTGEPTGACDF
jgi:hypothetical protein